MTPAIQDAARAIAARTLSPVELTQRMLARIRARNGTPHAFTDVTQARALADARAAEAQAMAGTLRGLLDGIPVARMVAAAAARWDDAPEQVEPSSGHQPFMPLFPWVGASPIKLAARTPARDRDAANRQTPSGCLRRGCRG